VLSSLFSLGIVLLTAISNRNDADQAGLERYLFGQAAGLSERDVEVTLLLGLAALAVVAIGFRAFKTALFDPTFAGATGLPVRLVELAMTGLLVVAVVVGLQMVGAILMVAMLIVPPVAARQLTNRLSVLVPLAGAIGAAVGVSGALLSARTQVPTGPVIVLVGFLVVLAAIALAPQRGVLWRANRLALDRRRALSEGVLVDLQTALSGRTSVPEQELVALGTRSRRELGRALRVLSARDGGALIVRGADGVSLTPAGRAALAELDERRRLWGAWLEHGRELHLGDAREADPRDLDSSLGEDAVRRLRQLDAERAPA
jgi:manganese/zinc/iron transport system permease protein